MTLKQDIFDKKGIKNYKQIHKAMRVEKWNRHDLPICCGMGRSGKKAMLPLVSDCFAICFLEEGRRMKAIYQF